MKERFHALDGLRGFAAFGVFLSHINIPFATVLSIPAISFLYGGISDGPNSVQILFVLSGFLMAYLYPTIPNAFAFIQKRYTRIFPLVIVVVAYLWVVNSKQIANLWYVQIATLIAIGLTIHYLWRGIKKINRSQKVGRILFGIFFMLQVLFALSILFLFSTDRLSSSTTFLFGATTAVANMMLLTPLSTAFTLLRATFWSLSPEILFYVIFPFFVVPLIVIGKRWGKTVTVVIIICVVKILFDLDHALIPIGSFQTINIARSSGFVAGVVLGSLYQSKNKIWNFVESISKNKFYSIFLIIVFFLMQSLGDGIRQEATLQFNNIFYLISSIIISIFIAAALTKGSVIQKIMSNKFMVFLGMISFSLYLIHIEVISWVSKILPLNGVNLSHASLYVLIFIAVTAVIAISISYLLFRFVEALYFSKKVTKTKQLRKEVKIEQKRLSIRTSIFAVVLCSFIFFVYTFTFSHSLLIEHVSVPNPQISLLQNPTTFQIHADHNWLGIISIDARYIGDPNKSAVKKRPADVTLSLFSDGKKIATTTYHAYLVKNLQQFQFGFQPIPNSKGKIYTARIILENGKSDDQVVLNNSKAVGMYVLEGGKFERMSQLTANRILFVLTDLEALFAILFFITTALGILYIEKLDKKIN